MRCPALLLAILLVCPAPAGAQHPGHLGKPPPTRTRTRVVPKWPRRPDPTPLRTAEYLDLLVELKAGQIKGVKVSKGRFKDGPAVIPRFRGRFEVTLHAHGLLLDIVRFDLPLTGAAENRAPTPQGTALGDQLGLGLARGVTTRARVRVPFTARLTRVAIRDSLKKTTTRVDISSVLPKKPGPRLPGDLRTRSFGSRRGEKGLEDSSVLRGSRPRAGPRKSVKGKKAKDSKTRKGR